MHYCYVIVDRDPVAQKQEDAGSLANFCPSLESGFDLEEQKKNLLCNFAKAAATKIRIFILRNFIYL